MANRFNNSMIGQVGTQSIEVYTVPADASTVTVIGFTVANRTTSNIYIDVSIRAVDSSQVYLLKGSIVEPGQTAVLVGGDQKVVLKAGQGMYVKSDIENSADVVVSVLEIL